MEYFEQRYGRVEPIGQGMEGAVYDLGDGLVGKVWFERRPDDVRPLKAFLDELPELPFRTPRIREISEYDGQAVTVEDKLTGTPLHEFPSDHGIDAFVEVVEALGKTVAGPAGKALAVLHQPFWREAPSWGQALAELVRRRAAQSKQPLEKDVDGFDALLNQLTSRLAAIELDSLAVIHGDICPPTC